MRRESSTVVVLVGAVAEPLLAGLARSSNVSLVRPPEEEKDPLTAAGPGGRRWTSCSARRGTSSRAAWARAP